MKFIKDLSILLSLLLIIFCNGVYAQMDIKGQVTDTDGETLIGANIMEKGTSNGTVTDLDGNFEFSVSGRRSQLIVSYTGYIEQIIE